MDGLPMNKIGLDIGSTKIKAVEISEQPGKSRLVSFDISNFPDLSLLTNSKAEKTEIINFLKEYLFSSRFTTSNVNICIPESQVFTKIVTMPNLGDKEMASSIKWEAQQYFPDSMDDLSVHFEILPKTAKNVEETGRVEVLLVAVSKSMMEKYMEIMEGVGVNVLGIEPESMSVSRAIKNLNATGQTLVVNIGAESSDVIIIEDSVIRFTRTLATGAISLSRAVARDIGLDEKRAESYLLSYGLDETKLDGKIFQATKPVFDIILGEINRSVVFFESRGKGAYRVDRIVVCGGGGQIPGILAYIAEKINIETEIANPWRLLDTTLFIEKQQDLESLAPIFTTAVGLALK